MNMTILLALMIACTTLIVTKRMLIQAIVRKGSANDRPRIKPAAHI